MDATSVAVLLLHLQWQDVIIIADDYGMEIFFVYSFYVFAGVIKSVHTGYLLFACFTVAHNCMHFYDCVHLSKVCCCVALFQYYSSTLQLSY